MPPVQSPHDQHVKARSAIASLSGQAAFKKTGITAPGGGWRRGSGPCGCRAAPLGRRCPGRPSHSARPPRRGARCRLKAGGSRVASAGFPGQSCRAARGQRQPLRIRGRTSPHRMQDFQRRGDDTGPIPSPVTAAMRYFKTPRLHRVHETARHDDLTAGIPGTRGSSRSGRWFVVRVPA
jgi:hypothetical protein